MTAAKQASTEMTPVERQETLVRLGKLLLDEERLKILGALAQQPGHAEALQTQLAVDRVQIHLHKLEEAGLIHKSTDQGTELYQLDHQHILQLKKLLFARVDENPPQSAAEKDLAKFIKGERLVQLPVAPAKLRLVLTWLVERFQPSVAYPEKAVNELLQGHAIDHVTLRRLLIDHGFLVRMAGIYQRPVSA